MSETLTIEVLAGMANRLRALISAICLAEDLDRNLHVIWSANDPACMARFESLWDRSTLPRWVTVDMGPLEGNNAVMVLSPADMEDYVKRGDTRPIRSYGHFHQHDMPRWLTYLRKLHPSFQLQAQMNLSAVFSSPRVGIHIRRGDHMKARQFSPLSAFIDAMKKESDTTQFLVATDDPNERRALESEFPGRVWFPATTLTRMTQKGMQDAMLDFIGLSRCETILGSYDSSFSQLAALYGKKTLRIVTQE